MMQKYVTYRKRLIILTMLASLLASAIFIGLLVCVKIMTNDLRNESNEKILKMKANIPTYLGFILNFNDYQERV